MTVTVIGILTVLLSVISVNRSAVGEPSLYVLFTSASRSKSLKELLPLLPLAARSGVVGNIDQEANKASNGLGGGSIVVGSSEILHRPTSSLLSTSLFEKDKGFSGSSSSGEEDDSSSELSASERLARKVRAVDGTPLKGDGIMRSRHGEAVAFSPKRRSAAITSPSISLFAGGGRGGVGTSSNEEITGQSGQQLQQTPLSTYTSTFGDRDRDLPHTHSALAILSGGGEGGLGASSKRRVRFNQVQEERFFDVNDALPILQPLMSPAMRMQQQQQQQQQ